MNIGEMVFQASLARKCGNSILDFIRLDYPQMDLPEWDKLIPIRQENGRVKSRRLDKSYHLQAPYRSDYESNYQEHK